MNAASKLRRLAMLRPLAVVLASIVNTVVGCSGDDSRGGGSNACATNGNCPNSPPPTATQKSTCEKSFGDPKCGSLFATYFDCALAQEQCTAAGVTDDAATRTAITTNCADPVAAYRSCAGSSTSEPQCGLGGLPCCTDGSPPCASTGCCDPATNKCTGEGQACTAGDTVCSGNKCGPCGAPGQPCCDYSGMTQPNPCPRGGCCNYSLGHSCIAEGGQCNAPDPRNTETVCSSGSCVTCGSEFGTCCAGGKCNDAADHCSAGMCMK